MSLCITQLAESPSFSPAQSVCCRLERRANWELCMPFMEMFPGDNVKVGVCCGCGQGEAIKCDLR